MSKSIIERVKQIAAQGTKYTHEEMEVIRARESKKAHDALLKEHEEIRKSNVGGRNGVMPLHEKCTIDNFLVNDQEMEEVRDFAQSYINNFHLNNGTGFIFSGGTGTGKNHLAASICNALNASGSSCLIITVTELMQKLRRCYERDSGLNEDAFIQSMVNLDLLVIDEIGLQRGTTAENLILNQIIDQRACKFKPTGMLTNNNFDEVAQCLGERIMDRMRMNGGAWKNFTWQSYRK